MQCDSRHWLNVVYSKNHFWYKETLSRKNNRLYSKPKTMIGKNGDRIFRTCQKTTNWLNTNMIGARTGSQLSQITLFLSTIWFLEFYQILTLKLMI